MSDTTEPVRTDTTASMLRATIEASGLSIREWAAVVAAGRDARTVERWLAGEPMPEAARRWLERLVRVELRGGDVVITVAR